MNKGKINLKEGELDLKLSLECGQTFLWKKFSGKPLYEETPCKKFYKVRGDNFVVLWQEGRDLHYRGTMKRSEIEELLNLDVDMEEIRKNTVKDEVTKSSFQEFQGLRIVNDEFFPCLISYIISAQMQIPRIKKIVNGLAERYGDSLNFDGEIYNKFPTPEQLSEASVKELKGFGMGYRAKYVKKTVEQILNREVNPESLQDLEYPEAKKELKKLMGVGNKVADCVLLFSLGFHESYPLDTWGKKVVEKIYPDFHDSRYWKVSENMRNYFGEYAGWAHEYLFHWARENREKFN